MGILTPYEKIIWHKPHTFIETLNRFEFKIRGSIPWQTVPGYVPCVLIIQNTEHFLSTGHYLVRHRLNSYRSSLAFT